MKHTVLIFLIAATLFSCSESTDHSSVPEVIRTAFQQRFPDAQKITWDMTSNADWEATFEQHNKSYTCRFNAKGEWLETDHKIIKAAVPLNVKLTLHDSFKEYKIEDATVAEKQSGLYYEMEILADGRAFAVEADAKGTLLKEQEHL